MISRIQCKLQRKWYHQYQVEPLADGFILGFLNVDPVIHILVEVFIEEGFSGDNKQKKQDRAEEVIKGDCGLRFRVHSL